MPDHQKLSPKNQARVRDAMIDTMADIAFQSRVENDGSFKAELEASLHAASRHAKQFGTKPVDALQREIDGYIDQWHA